MACVMIHPPLSAYSRYEQYPFYPCKRFTNTSSDTSAKWKVAESRKIQFCLSCPTIRIKNIWVREKTRTMMHYILTHQNYRSSRYYIFANFVIVYGLPTYGPGWRVHAHRFSKYLFCVFQLWYVFNCWDSSFDVTIAFIYIIIAKDIAQLFIKSSFYIWIL